MGRPRKFDETEVISAARDEFWSRGYAGTSIDDLIAATGLGKGSLYGAFGDKQRLFLRALDNFIDNAMGEVRGQLQDPRRDAFDRLVRHVRAQAKAVIADKTRRGCMMAKSAAELSATDVTVERAVERAYREWRVLLADCIAQAQRDGTIDPDRDARALATLLLGFMRGLEALHKGGVKPSQLVAATEEILALIPRI